MMQKANASFITHFVKENAMSDTVEEIVDTTQAGEQSNTEAEDNGTDLDDFVPAEYEHLYPVEVYDKLKAMLDNKEYGWKSRARMLKYLAQWHGKVKSTSTDIIESFNREPRTPKSPEDAARVGLRRFYLDLEVGKLIQAASQAGIVYTDETKHAVVEQLIDRVLNSVV